MCLCVHVCVSSNIAKAFLPFTSSLYSAKTRNQWVGGWDAGWVYGWVAKVDNVFGQLITFLGRFDTCKYRVRGFIERDKNRVRVLIERDLRKFFFSVSYFLLLK